METRECRLCGTPFRPRREDEAFCCKGCEFVNGLVGQAGAAPARMVKRGSRWLWAAMFFILAGFNTVIATNVSFTETKANGLFYLLAALFVLLGLSCLVYAGKAGRRPR